MKPAHYCLLAGILAPAPFMGPIVYPQHPSVMIGGSIRSKPPAELRVHTACSRTSAQIRRHEEPLKEDVELLFRTANGASRLAPEGFNGLILFRSTPYRARVIALCGRAARSNEEWRVFRGITLLENWKVPGWRRLALAHRGKTGELYALLVRDAEDLS